MVYTLPPPPPEPRTIIEGVRIIKPRKTTIITDAPGRPNPELTLQCGACGTKHPANTKRCDGCGCPNRLTPIKTADNLDLMGHLLHRSRLMAVWRRLRFPTIFSLSGGTESSGPC